jgi:predicted small secreted protein
VPWLLFLLKVYNFERGVPMTRLFFLTLLILSTVSLSACGNTFNGAGRDLEGWGKTLQETF